MGSRSTIATRPFAVRTTIESSPTNLLLWSKAFTEIVCRPFLAVPEFHTKEYGGEDVRYWPSMYTLTHKTSGRTSATMVVFRRTVVISAGAVSVTAPLPTLTLTESAPI